MKSSHELHYTALSVSGQALCFPFDAEGHVQMDSLTDAARAEHLYARAVVGKVYAFPLVTPVRH